MPDRGTWENFFDPHRVIMTLGINGQTRDVVEFGCGYGTFTLAAAKIIRGQIYALDIEPEMIRITDQEAKKQGIHNVRVLLRDFMAEGSGLPDARVDYVMLFNILHLEDPLVLLKEAKRVLKPDGKLGIIHWNYDPSTPRGPSIDIRPKPEDCIRWAESAGFVSPELYDLKPYHYGIVLTCKREK